jgi:hypothetical protein
MQGLRQRLGFWSHMAQATIGYLERRYASLEKEIEEALNDLPD